MIRPSIIVIFVFVLVLPGCDKQARQDDQVFTEADTEVEVGRDVEILYSDSAVVRVRITAPVLKNYSDVQSPRQVFSDGVRVEFLDPSLRITSVLTAKQGIREQNKALITVRDSVVLTSIKQERLETEELIWDERSGKVHTEKFVKVTKPGEIMYGYGLEANQDFSYWKILVPKGRIKTDKLDQQLDQ